MLQTIPRKSGSTEDREGFLSRILTRLNSLWVTVTYPFANRGSKLSLHYASEISRRLAPRIWLGSRVKIEKHAWLHIEGEHDIAIRIEDDCRISARCTISSKNSIHLERNVVLASGVLVMDHNHAFEDVSTAIWRQGITRGGRIKIREGCRIGQGAAILCDKGELVLGRNCVVTPGAVVKRSFPSDSVLSGNPARVIQKSRVGQGHDQQTPSEGSNETYEVTELKHEVDTYSKGSNCVEAGSSGEDLIGYSEQRASDEDLLSWFSRLAGKLRTLWLARMYPFASFGKGAWAHYSFATNRADAPYISIGKHVGFGRDAKLDVQAAPGAVPPVIRMDDRSGLQRRCMISARNHIHIMRDVIFGPSVLVMDHAEGLRENSIANRSPQPARGTIRIEEECWIGFGSVIVCEQGELTIGRHSVVGANSLITRSIPSYSVVAGNPARIVKQYDFSAGKWVLGCIRPAADADQPSPVHVSATPS